MAEEKKLDMQAVAEDAAEAQRAEEEAKQEEDAGKDISRLHTPCFHKRPGGKEALCGF